MPFGEQSIPQKGINDQKQMNAHEMGAREMDKTFLEIAFGYAKKFVLIVVLISLMVFIASDAFFMTKAGYIAIYENPRSEKVEVYMTPGFHSKVPFFPVTRYKHVWIVDFGTGYAGIQLRERKSPIELTFADTYKAKVPATFRYKLPTSKDRIKAIHQDFTSFDLLIDALLIPISRDVMVSTAALYTGEEFFQGGVSQFKAVLEDQIQNGTYKTKLINIQQEKLADKNAQESLSIAQVKLKTVLIRNEKGKIERLQTKSISDYGIELKQVTLGVPVPEAELALLLADKKRMAMATIKKADELTLIQENQKIQLAKFMKDEIIQLAKTKRDVKIQLADIDRNEKIEQANTKKAEKIQLVNVERETKIKLAKKAEKLALMHDEEKIQLANVEKEKKIKLARKAEELALVKEIEKIQLAHEEKEKKIKLVKKAEELALVKETEKIQLANVEKNKKIKLAQKAEELALVKEIEKVQLANVEKETKIKRAKKTEKLILVQDEQKVQVAEEAKNLAIVQEKQKVQEAEKVKDLAITLAETQIRMAKKQEELAIAQAALKIQKANFEAMQFEAKAILEKGNARAGVLKAEYLARIPEIYHAEIKKEIAEIIYSNLKGVNVTMPHNIVNFGEAGGNNLQTNLDILSSFATINVMEGMEKKALEK